VKIDTVEGYTHFQDNKKPEFLAKFPAGKIPAFIGTDGFVVTETSAVVKYGQSIISFGTLGHSLLRDEITPIQLSLS
jgi:elongation factor 1-gamma